MHSVHILCVKRCMQRPLAVHQLNTINNNTALRLLVYMLMSPHLGVNLVGFSITHISCSIMY